MKLLKTWNHFRCRANVTNLIFKPNDKYIHIENVISLSLNVFEKCLRQNHFFFSFQNCSNVETELTFSFKLYRSFYRSIFEWILYNLLESNKLLTIYCVFYIQARCLEVRSKMSLC